MKKLLLASLAVLAMGAQAAPTALPGVSFDVTASVDPICRAISGSSTGTVAFGTYIGFSSALTSAGTFKTKVECTKGVTSVTAAVNGDTYGEVAGVNYTLAVGVAQTQTGSAASANTVGPNGTADEHEITVTGTIPGGQAGSTGWPTASPDTDSRVLVVSF